MELKSVRVPAGMEGPFLAGEASVVKLFSTLSQSPETGTIRVGGQRYVLVRCESLYLDWFSALEESFGDEVAREFIYNTARAIGRSDAKAFAKRLGLTDPIERLSCGPCHFAHAGWAFVEILGDSAPAPNDDFFLHYHHPNTFESEVVKSQGTANEHCVCLFSAGYSAGWCSSAFDLALHGRELRCVARGDDKCEFIMSPASRIDAHEARIRASWPTNG